MSRLKKILEDAYGNVVAAERISIPSDDQIIIGYVRKTSGLLYSAMVLLREIEEKDRRDALAEKRIRVKDYLAEQSVFSGDLTLGEMYEHEWWAE